MNFLENVPLSLAIGCDVTVVIACIVLLFRQGRLRHSHPATIYLFFHLYAVTARAIAIARGAPTLFSMWGSGYDGVGEGEISRAILMADVALLAMVAAWIGFHRFIRDARGESVSRPIVPRYVWGVMAFAFPIGCAGLFTQTVLPGGMVVEENVTLGEWQESSWISIIQTWPGLCLLALIFLYGFRWWLVTPMGFYLMLMAYQGYHRFRVIIPMIMLIQIYLDRRGRKWPTLLMSCALAGTALLFFPLKSIGTMAQSGYSAGDIMRGSIAIVETAFSGEHADESFLDQMASVVTLVDEKGKFYWGEPYAALVTLPIPRQWWPDKPGVADYMDDFSQNSRPMRESGMIATIIGESYANFGYGGIVLVPLLLAWCLAWACARAYASNYFSVARFGYLLLACNLIQVFRDGVVSMVIFTAVNMMPLVVIILLHLVFAHAPQSTRAELPQVRRGPESPIRT